MFLMVKKKKKRGGVERSLSFEITGKTQVLWFENCVSECDSMDEPTHDAIQGLFPVYACLAVLLP